MGKIKQVQWLCSEQHKNLYGFQIDKSLLYTKADIISKENSSFFSVLAQSSKFKVQNLTLFLQVWVLICFSLITVSRASFQMLEGEQLLFYYVLCITHLLQESSLLQKATQLHKKGFIKYPGFWQEDKIEMKKIQAEHCLHPLHLKKTPHSEAISHGFMSIFPFLGG